VNEAPFLYTTELDNIASLCFRATDSSNYDVRCDVAKLLGRLLAATQTPQAAQGRHFTSVDIDQITVFIVQCTSTVMVVLLLLALV